jgi:hypothetical protein
MCSVQTLFDSLCQERSEETVHIYLKSNIFFLSPFHRRWLRLKSNHRDRATSVKESKEKSELDQSRLSRTVERLIVVNIRLYVSLRDCCVNLCLGIDHPQTFSMSIHRWTWTFSVAMSVKMGVGGFGCVGFLSISPIYTHPPSPSRSACMFDLGTFFLCRKYLINIVFIIIVWRHFIIIIITQRRLSNIW